VTALLKVKLGPIFVLQVRRELKFAGFLIKANMKFQGIHVRKFELVVEIDGHSSTIETVEKVGKVVWVN
jgi:hypothetical protein